MRKTCVVAILFALSQLAFAQDSAAAPGGDFAPGDGFVPSGGMAPGDFVPGTAALGAGAEVNMNAHNNFAGGAALGLDFALPYAFAAGLSATASFNSGLTAVEAAALLRRYFGAKGFFLQADAGALFYLEAAYREERLRTLFSGGLRAGFRIPLGAMPSGTAFYIEPYARGGYPFIFSAGVIAGARFIHKGETINR